MSVVAADLLSPAGGELEAEWFPADSGAALTARLTAYLNDAVTKGATTDAGIASWAYYRAYKAIWLGLSAGGASAAIVGEESVGWTTAQIAAFKTMADEALADFEDEVPVVAVSAMPFASSQQQATTRW